MPLGNPAGTNEACNLTSKQYVINFFGKASPLDIYPLVVRNVGAMVTRGLFYLGRHQEPSVGNRVAKEELRAFEEI